MCMALRSFASLGFWVKVTFFLVLCFPLETLAVLTFSDFTAPLRV